MPTRAQLNPHFDEGIFIWSDDYAERYAPPPGDYRDQFDDKWRLVLEDVTGLMDSSMNGPGSPGPRGPHPTLLRLQSSTSTSTLS